MFNLHRELAKEWIKEVDRLKRENEFEYEDAENRMSEEILRLKGRNERLKKKVNSY